MSENNIRVGGPPKLTADEIAKLAGQLAASLDDEPFRLIGYAAISASVLDENLGDHLRQLAAYEPRLQPVLATIVAAMPMIADLAPWPDQCAQPLPPWLDRFGEARITTALVRPERPGRSNSSYLFELAVPTVRRATAVVRLGDCSGRLVVTDLHTMTASASEAADDLLAKFEWENRQPYEPARSGPMADTRLRAVPCRSPIPWLATQRTRTLLDPRTRSPAVRPGSSVTRASARAETAARAVGRR